MEHLNWLVWLVFFLIPLFGICNVSTQIRIEDKIEDITTLEETLKQLGVPYVKNGNTIRFGNGVLVDITNKIIRYSDADKGVVNDIKQNYAANVITKIGRKKGFLVTKKKVGTKIQVKVTSL